MSHFFEGEKKVKKGKQMIFDILGVFFGAPLEKNPGFGGANFFLINAKKGILGFLCVDVLGKGKKKLKKTPQHVFLKY